MHSKLMKMTVVSSLALVSVLGGAQTAQAGVGDGYCNKDTEFCFYYNSKRYGWGSGIDFNANVKNLSGYTFKSPGNGRGVAVKNNAGAVWNKRGSAARVYYNSGWGGVSDYVGPRTVRDLDVTKNDNASFKWI